MPGGCRVWTEGMSKGKEDGRKAVGERKCRHCSEHSTGVKSYALLNCNP